MRLMYLLSIAAASRSILLSAAYFVPDDLSVQMLVAARKRGVRVVIIMPGPNIDAEITRKASRRAGGRCSRRASRSASTSPRCTTAR